MTLDGMRWSVSKVQAIRASMLPEEHFIDYVFSTAALSQPGYRTYRK